jgi:predicted nucleic acid-binding protein
MMRKTIVIDASVLLKVYLPDEEATASVDNLMRDHQQGRLSLVAPALMRYEVANALRTAAYRRRISNQHSSTIFTADRLIRLGIYPCRFLCSVGHFASYVEIYLPQQRQNV